MKKKYVIEGFLLDRLSNKGISGLTVEAWERDSKRDDYLGIAESVEDGSITIKFSDDDYRDFRGFAESAPNVYLKVLREEKLIVETSTQKISSNSALNKIRIVVEINQSANDTNSIKINNWEELCEHEPEILQRIKALPNGDRAFVTHPLLCLTMVGVNLSEKFRDTLIRLHPTLALKSPFVFRAILNNKIDDNIKMNLSGLFRRSEK